mmetsp:Transcript_126958/g.353575  ORF Transcript_126958/g.353575 Transcript_126958/m.353575 type:complete len:341 (-) Transcript_126958:9-1031(-)
MGRRIHFGVPMEAFGICRRVWPVHSSGLGTWRRISWAKRRSCACTSMPLLAHRGGNVAIVVRVHNGTSEAMLRRHVEWASELACEAAQHNDEPPLLWFLVDETYGGEYARRRIYDFIHEAGLGMESIRCVPYTEAEMISKFPVLHKLREALPDTQNVRDCFVLPCQKSLAWCYHVEAILVWWVQVTTGSKEPPFVWVIEDDAGYSGSISRFIRAYSDNNSDLLTHALQRVHKEWVWYNTASPAFLDLAHLTERLRCAEHVQRMSSRLLHILHQYSIQGVSGWSEMSVPTLCRMVRFKLGTLRSEHIGGVFAFDGKVPQALWPGICAEPSTQNRWWHALKW